MEKTLFDLDENKCATILKVTETSDAFLQRLQEFGLVSGEKIRIITKAPKSEVFLVSIRGFALCIDKQTCKKVVVCD